MLRQCVAKLGFIGDGANRALLRNKKLTHLR